MAKDPKAQRPKGPKVGQAGKGMNLKANRDEGMANAYVRLG